MATVSVESVRKARATLKMRLTNFEKSVVGLDPKTIAFSRYENLETQFAEIRVKTIENVEVLYQMEAADKESEVEEEFEKMSVRFDILDKLFALCADRFKAESDKEQERNRADQERIRKEKADLEKELELARIQAGIPTTPPQPQSAPAPQRPKLPQLTLPIFDGKYEEWLPFRDRFNQSVHNRTDITGCEKFMYLLSSLKGPAAEAIKTIPVSNDSYQNAYDRLKNLFEHTREIAYSIVDRILNEKPISCRSQEALLATSNLISNAVASLQSVDATVDVGDLLLLRITARILDSKTLERFHLSLSDNQIPKLKSFLSFIDKEMLSIPTASQSILISGGLPRSTSQPKSSAASTSQQKPAFTKKCIICSAEHPHFKCAKLNEAPEKERKKIVDQAKLCTNCLGHGHGYKDCSSTRTCKSCGQKHHTLLHASFSKPTPAATSNLSTSLDSNSELKLKPTAIVQVGNHLGQKVACRALIDNCSDSSFIQESMVRELGLKSEKLPHRVTVKALESKQVSSVSEVATLTITSTTNPAKEYSVRAFILKKIGGAYPARNLDSKSWSHLSPITGKLADPEFSTARKVEILLATDIYHEIIQGSVIRGDPGEPVALDSAFGWLVGGGTNVAAPQQTRCNLIDSVEVTLQKFFELEQGPEERKLLTAQEATAENHYETTTTRLPSGTYQVELPFKAAASPLGNSRGMAIKRFYALESKFRRAPEIAAEYKKSMHDLLTDGHTEAVPSTEIFCPDESCYYLPHHGVIKNSSSTTKLRIVYDASARTSNGNSLNDNLMVGPVIQQDLISLLIRWRYWLVPLTADIKQMYLYIEVAPHHRDYLRILWRESEQDPLQTFRLKKVTFGTASAPYQAIRTLFQLAQDHAADFPKAAAILRRDFYVDDCLTGADNTQEAIELYKDLVEITAKANFTLRKWSSSDKDVIETVPEEMREVTSLSFDKDESTKALGLVWNPARDEFRFQVAASKKPATTKRAILSEIAKVFDPLGFLAPVTVRAKILMQMLWKLESGWDEKVPAAFHVQWNSYRSELENIHQLHIPRCINLSGYRLFQLHGFSDASEKAYAAAVYLRVVADNSFQTRLIVSKTRVAPTKGETIPRLELCGAVLLAQLMTTVSTSLDFIQAERFGWTDSTIALAWIQSENVNWKTFVRNRVITIQEHLPAKQWNHIPGVLNPADLPSRGIPATELLTSELWWQGPEFLRNTIPHPKPTVCPRQYPQGDVYTPSVGDHNSMTKVEFPLSTTQQNIVRAEMKTETARVLVTAQVDPAMPDLNSLFSNCSSWTRLRRRVAWWIRLWNYSQAQPVATTGLTPEELGHAESRIIYYVQQSNFGGDLQSLEQTSTLQKKSKLLSLTPFIKDGLLRVGGRIPQADLPYDNRHPLLLPNHHVTDLIYRHFHFDLKHGGPTLLQSVVARKFWVVRGRNQAKKIINRCKVCRILKARPPMQLMADLPKPRVNPSQPFTHTGVDYAGPINLRESSLRKARVTKAYIAVFVCLCTKAVTLELVSDLTTETFIAALERFSSRRRRPTSMKSDNGTTFVGAARELEELYKFLATEIFAREVIPYLTDRGVKWTFIPPAAPHMGGLWEAAVKSAKFHIKRVIGTTTLTFEQYDTLLKQVEALLNSRPLCQISSDPNDLTPLTPGHFLCGYPPVAYPDPDVRHEKVTRLSRWQHVQLMKQHFWYRWTAEYLQQLQRRTKWKSAEKNVKIGDLAVIRDEQLPPQCWKMARILEVHPNPKDEKKMVRTVTVRTATGIYVRPITKLVLLPDPAEEEE